MTVAVSPVRARTSRSLQGAAARLPRAGVVHVAIATLAVLLIASPMLFTHDGFAPEFTTAIWLVGYQQHAIATYLHPTLFLQTQQVGIFDPLFAFYGATLFALTGALAAILGGATAGPSTIFAFEAVTLAAIAAAYGGLFWLARQLGVRGALAHAPALVFVTSAYYVTNLYGRGDWEEFMAVSALPLLMAASLRLVRGGWRVGPAACLVAASVVFSGSHNITLLWGTTLAVLALALYWLLSGFPRTLPWRRMAAVAGLISLGLCLNGWFLLPDVSYAHDTLISGELELWSTTAFFNTFGVIFDPLRTVPIGSTTPALYVQAPVLALAWGLLALPLVWRERRLRAGAATALVVLIGLLAVIMSQAVFLLLPRLFQQVQFAFRLQTYVALACSGLVMLGALALTRRAQSARATRTDHLLTLGLGLAVAFGVALGGWQLWAPNTHIPPNSYDDRAEALRGPPAVVPKSFFLGDAFGDRNLPVLTTTTSGTFEAASVKDDRLAGVSRLPAGGQPFATNIAGGPNLVHVGGGVRVVGRTAEGDLVLQRAASGSRPVPFELSARRSAPVLLGRIVTGASAALLLALALAATVRRGRRRSAARPSLDALRREETTQC